MKQRCLAHIVLAFTLLGTFAFIMFQPIPGLWGAQHTIAAGDGYTQYFPIVHRARPGIRDLVGLNTVQFLTSEGSDIVTLRMGGFLTAVTFGNNQNDDSPSWSSTQELILARTYPLDGEPERGNLVVIEGEYYLGTITTPITQNDNLKREFQWSPRDDISYLESTPEGRTNLWIAPAGIFTPTVVLTDVVYYRWSPTGDAIAFTANRDGDTDIFLSTSDGSTITPLTDNSTNDELIEWVSGGADLLMRRTDGTNDDLWVVARDGTNERQLTNQSGSEVVVAVSPDGSQIAYLQHRLDGATDLFMQGIQGAQPDPSRSLWTCSDDPNCFIGDAAWSPSNDKLVWRIVTEIIPGFGYENLLLYSNIYEYQVRNMEVPGVPVGRPVWAEGTDWLIYAVIEPNTTTTNIYAQEVTDQAPLPEEALTSGDSNFMPLDWQQIYTPMKGPP